MLILRQIPWSGQAGHGTRNEKLVELGLQPFRGRTRAPKEGEPTLKKTKKQTRTAIQPVALEAEPPKADESES